MTIAEIILTWLISLILILVVVHSILLRWIRSWEEREKRDGYLTIRLQDTINELAFNDTKDHFLNNLNSNYTEESDLYSYEDYLLREEVQDYYNEMSDYYAVILTNNSTLKNKDE